MSLTHTHGLAGAVALTPVSGLPDWLDPLYEADEMRAVDAWAIEEAGTPSLDLMERAGRRPGACGGRCRGRAARCAWWWARATTAATGWWPPACCARTATWSSCSRWRRSDELRGDAAVNLERLPGEPPEPFAPERLERRGSGGGRAARHRLRGRAARSGGRARSRRSTPSRRPWWPATCRRGWTPRPARWRARPCGPRSTATFHGSKVGPLRGAGQEPRRRRGGGGDRRPARRARAASGRA